MNIISLLLLSASGNAQAPDLPIISRTDTIVTDSVAPPVRTIGNHTIRGNVSEENGSPAIGAVISVNNFPMLATTTDVDGRFILRNVPEGSTIKVSYIGCKPQEETITPGKDNYPFTLHSDPALLDEVVVVGYGRQKKVNLTGSVASVNVGALEARPVTNVTNALAGLASGLTVTNSGGNTPGYEAQSITVRGLGTLNDASPLVVVDGMTGISLSDINPGDIENISVLKDAASASIYGSRAANGVILVTTRQGKERAPRVTYSGNVSFETVAKRLNLVTNYADFMEIQNRALVANGQAPRFSQGKIDEWRNDAGQNPTIYPNTDWQDHIYRNPSVVQNHNLSVAGGSATARYNVSLGFVNNPGMIYHTDYRRLQLRSNIDVTVKPWLSVGTNLFGFYDTNNPSSENAAEGGDVIFGYGAFNTVPGMTLYDPATGLYGGIQNPEEENVSNANPYRRQWFYDDKYPVKTRRMAGKVFARITPVTGLVIQGTYAMNYWERNIEHHLTDRDLYRFTFDGPVLIREGVVRTYIRRYNYRNTFRSSELTATYNFDLGKLTTQVLAGMSQEYNKYDQDYFITYDLIDPSLGAIDAAMTDGSITGSYSEWAMRSYFGRINLNWDRKYLLEANIRADGSSKFAPGHRWGTFPSVSAAWRIAREPFMEGASSWLNQLKLRASYGSLGNNATTSYYMYQSLFATANYILNSNIAGGLAQTVLANPNLTWEKTYMTNIGLDFALFNRRLRGSFDIYNKDTKGILISLPAPLEHGTSVVPNVNAGRVNNKGFEAELRWSDHLGPVTYSVSGNLSFVNNKVTAFQGDVASINGVYKTQEGYPINQIYVLSVDRIVRDRADLDYVQSLVDANPEYFATYQRPELGDFLYRDTNGDGKLDANDRVEIGHGTLPRLTYGANIALSWNNFDFSLLLQGVGDYKVYYNNQAFRFVTVMGQSLIKDITDNAWTPENPYNSIYPQLRNSADSRNNVASDAFVHNAAYLRCKNIQLGYTIPKKLVDRCFIDNIKVYVSFDNLFTLTSFPGLDPEVGATVGYPALRQYSIGLNITF